MRLARGIRSAVIAATLIAALAACGAEPRGGAERMPGELSDGASFTAVDDAPAAPSLEGELVDGTPVDLDALAAGRPLLVQFAATWCTTCADQEAALAAVAREYGDDLAIAIVTGDEQPADVTAYLDRRGLPYPVIADPDLRIWRAYAVTEPPATALIDAQGGLVRVWPGGAVESTMREQLDRIITG
ncbi:TlpA family protein disulfide reductase [Agromyces sp. NPDC055661]|jgi:peroxiredoxin